MSAVLYIVVPCYNESETLANTTKELTNKLDSLIAAGTVSADSKILYVDDGSTDSTWAMIQNSSKTNLKVCGLRLSRNRGHQTALWAGLMAVKDKADIAISIDADLQQDINAMELMIDKYNHGCNMVLGVRNDRATDGFFKKTTAKGFYTLMKVLGCNTVENHADYRLMDKKVLNSLSEYEESNLFLRGLIHELGYVVDTVYFDVKEREFGESKYTLKKMIQLAVNGISSFSIRPLMISIYLGLIVVLISVIMIIYTVVSYFMGYTVEGWATVVCSVWFLGGVQLLFIGVVGEYVGKNYIESKHRPKYHVMESIWNDIER